MNITILSMHRHYRTIRGMNMVRKNLEDMGHKVEEQQDMSLNVHSRESISTKERLFEAVLLFIFIALCTVLYNILGGL